MWERERMEWQSERHLLCLERSHLQMAISRHKDASCRSKRGGGQTDFTTESAGAASASSSMHSVQSVRQQQGTPAMSHSSSWFGPPAPDTTILCGTCRQPKNKQRDTCNSASCLKSRAAAAAKKAAKCKLAAAAASTTQLLVAQPTSASTAIVQPIGTDSTAAEQGGTSAQALSSAPSLRQQAPAPSAAPSLAPQMAAAPHQMMTPQAGASAQAPPATPTVALGQQAPHLRAAPAPVMIPLVPSPLVPSATAAAIPSQMPSQQHHHVPVPWHQPQHIAHTTAQELETSVEKTSVEKTSVEKTHTMAGAGLPLLPGTEQEADGLEKERNSFFEELASLNQEYHVTLNRSSLPCLSII
jgi:hypothetical protein